MKRKVFDLKRFSGVVRIEGYDEWVADTHQWRVDITFFRTFGITIGIYH